MKFISFLTNSNLKVKKLRSTKFVKQKLAKLIKVVYKLNDTKDNYFEKYNILILRHNIKVVHYFNFSKYVY